MKFKPGKCLIFLEDPGAANFFYRIIEPLTLEGINLIVVAEGHAKEFLHSRDVLADFQELNADAQSYLSSNNIKLIVVGTSENPESNAFKLIEAARFLTIPVIGVVDGPGSSGQRFKGLTQDPLYWVPEWLIVPDAVTAKLYHDLGFNREQIRIFNHPQYDHALSMSQIWTKEDRLNQRRQFLNESDERSILMFISEISTGLEPDAYKRSENYTLQGTSGHDGRTEIVLEELLLSVANLAPRPYMILRLHPKQTPDDLKDYLEYFDFVSRKDPALEIVNAADIIVGMTSSLLVEAFYLNKPVLAIIPDPSEKLYLGDLASDIKSVSTREEIMDELSNDNKLWYGRAPKAKRQSISQIIKFIHEIYPVKLN